MGATSFPASAIVSGTIDAARLGTGVVGDGLKYLADDNTFKSIDLSGYATESLLYSELGLLPEIYLGIAATTAYTRTLLDDVNAAAARSTLELSLINPTANLIEQRNGTNAQRLRVAKTWTNATSFEQFQVDAASDASNFDLVALRGSAGGSARGIRVGGRQDGASFVPWLSFATTGAATFAGAIAVNSVSDGGLGDNVLGSIRRDNGYNYYLFDANTFRFGNNVVQEWYSTISILGTPDIRISRNATGPTYDVRCVGGIRSRNFANNADSPISCSNLTASGTVSVGTYTVATLPAVAANAGRFAQVTDSNSTTNGNTVAGGGANRVPVFSNGTNWIIK